MYGCLFKKMGHFHTNVIFLCRKYADFIPYLLVKAIPLLVLWFQHICLTGDNQKRRRKNDYFWINSCRPNVRLSTPERCLWGTHRNIILWWLIFSFEQSEPQSSESCCFCSESGDLGKEVFFLMSLLKKMPGCPQGCSRSHRNPQAGASRGVMSFANLLLTGWISSKMNLSCWKVTTNPPYLWKVEFSFRLGKKRWILGWELQTEMDNQRTAPEPAAGAWCKSWELLCSQHSNAAGPVLLRWHQMFGTCCWSFLNSHYNSLK